jgi:hypothetical protein
MRLWHTEFTSRSPRLAAPSLPVTALAVTALAVMGLAVMGLAGPAAGSASAAVVPNLLLNGTVNQPVSGKLPGSGTFTVTSPNLVPPGIVITPAGAITGIPTADGIYGVAVSECGTSGCTPGTVTFTIAPDAAPCDNQPSIGSATVTAS